ncbi:MAG: hypothetical protein E6J90_46220 [Deltaproteobacteria bacterium]|nr:MAG: hypothetical protein E6J91_38320 [Deltaproteobacteria bacterium]TMQ06496.1 MAG: hypothetical protein E6J90_46220 [Deltaproteobacteria bacterium]
MDKAALKAEIARRVKLREEANEEMSELARQRDEYLKKNARGGERSFDTKVKATIDAQLR